MPENSTACPLWKDYSARHFQDDPETLAVFARIPTERARDYADQLLWMWETKQIADAQLEFILSYRKGENHTPCT